jgi:hypothetical protein
MYTFDDIKNKLKNIPYPEQVTDIFLLDSGVRFTWRGNSFRISIHDGNVEECQKNIDGNTLNHSNIVILMQTIIALSKERQEKTDQNLKFNLHLLKQLIIKHGQVRHNKALEEISKTLNIG